MNSIIDELCNDAHYTSNFEEEILRLGAGIFPGNIYSDARDILCTSICEVCHIQGSYAGGNIERLLGKVDSASVGHRTVAILLIRALSVDGLLPIDEPHSPLPRKIVSLIEAHLPDIKKYCKVDKQQTYEKINMFRAFHSAVCANFRIISNLPFELGEISMQRELILKALRHGQFQSYLQPFNYSSLKPKLESICDKIESLQNCPGGSYKANFDELELSVANAKDAIKIYTSFFSKDFVFPFLNSVESVLSKIKESSSEQFKSTIEALRRPPKAAAKRYPLHQIDKSLTFTIPMINKGPSTAVDVRVEIDLGSDNQSLILESEELNLGDVPPGDFSISLKACVLTPVKTVKMTVQVNWREVFEESDGIVFDVVIEGQDSTVDWNSLESLEPYSLEVAEGSMFVGRTAKVKKIGSKLLKRPMTSTYITGQKRIGKTSLARAVIDFVELQSSDFHALYLEYGEYCTTSPEKTLKCLGESIFDFLHGYLPFSDRFVPDFSESISDLNKSARLLEARSPDARFIVVLDEFDEIHPEMYRIGALAETFFANLRTLAARNNLAFILVGGERMPFIIGAQGDQLNKFSREPLDFFSRSSEWNEYLELVARPVEGKLNWDAAAINDVFTLTNGHPYYTKLLCSKIVSVAVTERDTEIILSDVNYGLNILLSELDTNAFAHMWKDGINSERDQSEVTELRRLRALVAIGRSFRSGKYTAFDIKSHVDRVKLQDHEVQPLLDDFLRRDILRERQGDLYFTVPLFQKWLVDFGISKLITSTFADDLESSIKEAEDQAYVTAAEIQTLTHNWPLYKAQKIGGESVRAWLDQVPTFQEQRLLFKLLQNLRFVSSAEVDDKLRSAHDRFTRVYIGVSTITKKSDRRSDLIITYVDGPGKSGAQCARDYAKINSISTTCIVDPSLLPKKLSSHEGSKYDLPKAIVIVDDVVGSGKTLHDGLSLFLSQNEILLADLEIPVLVIVLISTEDGEKKIKKINSGISLNFHFCELLGSNNFAFPDDGNGFWNGVEEKYRAKSLCSSIGAKLYKSGLGYKDQGLLLVLPSTCPNNSLPILFKAKIDNPPWVPLFLRPTT